MVILSDLSEVLIRGVEKVDELIALRYGKEAAERYSKRRIAVNDDFQELLRGKISEGEYFKIFLSNKHWLFKAKQLKKFFSEEFMKEIPGTLDTYLRISAHPRSFNDPTMEEDSPRIITVSDHIDEHITEIMCQHADIFTMTYDQIWSCDVGMIKQDPGFFSYLLGLYALDPAECIFIDDLYENIEAARTVGIKSIQFHDAFQLEDELTALGFEFYA